jgi:SAM-dependent methyltransferase
MNLKTDIVYLILVTIIGILLVILCILLKKKKKAYENFTLNSWGKIKQVNNNSILFIILNLEKSKDRWDKIKKVFDFGSGIGNIGFLLKKKFNHIELFSSENDQFCKEVLKNREYKNYENLNLINERFDLIISAHSLEHMKDLNIINLFKCFIDFYIGKNVLIFITIGFGSVFKNL